LSGGIVSYLGVEDEKAGLKFSDPDAHLVTMFRQQFSALRLGSLALRAQLRITQHLLNRHAGRLEATQELDPREDGRVIHTLACAVSRREGKKPDALVVSNRVGCKA